MSVFQKFAENKNDLTRKMFRPILAATGVAVLTSSLAGCDVASDHSGSNLKKPVDKTYSQSYVDQHKKRFKSHYLKPKKRVSGFEDIPVDQLYHKGMQKLDAGENVFVQNIQKLSVKEAALEAQQFLQKQSRFRPDKMQDMSANEQASLAASVILSLRHDGTTGVERDYQESFLKKYEPSYAYKAQEKEMATSLAADLASDHVLQSNLHKWVDRGAIKTQEQAEQQYALRAEAMQYISDKVHDLYGVAKTPVQVVYMNNVDLRGVRIGSGAHTESANRIKLNNNREFWGLMDNMNTFEDAVHTLIHEAKHSVDAHMVKELLRGNLSEQSPEYGHAVVSYVNSGAGYIDNDLPWHQSAYEAQYAERSANHFADTFNTSYKHAQKSQTKIPTAKID